ncbi:hypothetical protein CFC21_035882 [Triticum aestivum]|uniref:Symplekin n=4 Tax=Triticum TaxID=4564 RepID=A0A9R0RMB1_TRITD|nr:uncharacterized protein LOC123061806 [Triticum aestivum]KAF7023351.1 hypothetical protein CFC21_035882 [Triticum aestivum]VAH62946.1 unnamed protein product [Triticum turgidum subsp. durum]
MEFEADGARWPEQRGGAAEAPPPPQERGEVPSPRFDSSRALRLLTELDSNVTEDLVVLMPNLLSFLKHDDPAVVKQSIASGTNLFAAVLEEMALQVNECGRVDAWLEEMWAWMNQFKDAVCVMMREPVPIASKLLAVKFIETWILCLTPQSNSDRMQPIEGKNRRFDASRLAKFHPSLDPVVLEADANRTFIILVDIVQSAYAHRGSFLVGTINSLAAIGKSRPVYYDRALSVLFGFDPNLETSKGAHSGSLKYSLKTAFLGFLRSPCQAMLESKDVLVRRLRALSPGEATEQIIRQAEKMSRNIERACRTNKDEHPTWEMSYGDVNRKNSTGRSSDTLAMAEGMAKRARFDSSAASNPLVQGIPDYSDMQIENDANMGHSSDPSLLSTDVSPVEKMIEMIGALLAEGERGAESLGILISSVESDVMADIVIETMKHLPEAPFPLARNKSVPQPNLQSPSNPSTENLPGNLHSLPFTAQSVPSADGAGISPPEVLVMPGVSDSKRDPRRDPRRLDPRRTVAPAATSPMQMTVEITSVHQTNSLSNTLSPLHGKIEKCADYSADPPKNEDEEHPSSKPHQPMDEERSEFLDDSTEPETKFEVYPPVEAGFPSSDVNEEMNNPLTPEAISNNGSDSTDLEVGPFSPVSKTSTPEDTNHELPLLPSHLELSDSEKISLHKLAIGRIIDDYKKNSINSRFSLLAHLVAQSTADDNIMDLIQMHIILHNHDQKGHELAMHVLYQLQCVNVADAPESSISISEHYEKFFISLAKLLIDVLPASDKSFSKLLCDAPCLPESLFRFLEGLCMSQGNNQQTKDNEGDRVTQGLGTVWSLILGRPPLRQACLDIVLKCAIHSQDEVRGKAVRLVAKKLYDLTYASEKVEQFATDSLLAIANKHGVSTDVNFTTSKESTSEVEVSNQEASVSGSQISESGSTKTSLISPKQSAISVSEAKRHTSLFFALCTKRPTLLRQLFNVYGGSPKVVKQCIHWHIPTLVRNLGSSCPEMLDIIHSPPEGSEELVTMILQTLTEESNPSANLVVAVKHLYETKLKDASILIPLLSSFPKEEVLPIFPRLVDLSPDRFQDALARILQGSAHTGPALTPAEVLIAIHDINPEKDKVPLKKVIDACTACFEQRTVFTQQVLEKALNKLVDNVPIPLLFMRTVIQALDAFPALVDFVMGILSRLVNKQIWKMPKLWVGFLKLAYQTQPRSFDVLLQLPPPQLEVALNKYPNLPSHLSSFVNRQNLHNKLPRHTLNILGFLNEPQQAPMPFAPAALQTADTTSSLPGANIM